MADQDAYVLWLYGRGVDGVPEKEAAGVSAITKDAAVRGRALSAARKRVTEGPLVERIDEAAQLLEEGT